MIAGAGPGDPELVTLKTVRYLQQADVILTDRLVSDDLLSQYVKAARHQLFMLENNVAEAHQHHRTPLTN